MEHPESDPKAPSDNTDDASSEQHGSEREPVAADNSDEHNAESSDERNGDHDRRIRSFVRRAGRLTPAQSKALEDLLPRFGVPETPAQISSQSLFGDNRPLVLEIGFGNGDALVWMAQQQADHGFVGLEVHRPGVGHVLRAIETAELNNVRVLETDAVEFLKHRIAPNSLAGLRIYFPDPWHKKRHNKRRLVQSQFLAMAVERLQVGGVIHMATDWEHYAEQMMEVCGQHPELVNVVAPGAYAERPDWRPVTRFEQRGRRLGHGVWDLLFRREQN
ncbi:MAG: tRNA (guanosine(46)-N7)-methyltransferase TrmB [Xanthomonadales bacterium]|nr:tRNA (guanosine(46)-N7)-methyltransferase TrmB [Xanthomonadales bacterium]